MIAYTIREILSNDKATAIVQNISIARLQFYSVSRLAFRKIMT